MKTAISDDATKNASRVDLSEESRERMTVLLNETLASLTDLYTQTKFSH